MDAPTPGLPPYIDALCERLSEMLPRALAGGDEEAVHQSRVTTRRLSAAVELYRPRIEAPVARASRVDLKKLRRGLGELRDIDVMLGHLEEFSKSRRIAGAIRWLRPKLEGRRQEIVRGLTARARHKALARLDRLGRFRQGIAQAGVGVEQLLGQSLRNQLLDFAMRAEAISRQDGNGRTSADPHELRIAGKALRYTFEMAQQGGLEVGEATLKLFKRMQDALGLWHDYAILAQTLLGLAVDEELAIHDGVVFGKVLLFGAELGRRAGDGLGDFKLLWAEHGAWLREAAARPTMIGGTTAPEMGPHPGSTAGSAAQGAFGAGSSPGA